MAAKQGCGKSLSAKAAGKLFDVPLLRLDMGRLMGKYVGESEENMRKAIRLAEAISPCVLWVDELEKAFVSGKGRLCTEDIIECINSTSSLSEIMGDQIKGLQETYEKNKFKKASR